MVIKNGRRSKQDRWSLHEGRYKKIDEVPVEDYAKIEPQMTWEDIMKHVDTLARSGWHKIERPKIKITYDVK